ncbi:hypothetical protein [Dyella sp.]|jgi:hypothetical protein|uniref:hypothetical protein n=1 Tax=Dyella sp. TaxID=1869338 RepID=UPI002D7872EB|nr:hypothetical protein [Dyella sp.]HET6430845.1 hypothetical protein [Dyella sp.]
MKTTLHTVLCVAVRLGAVLLAVAALENLARVVVQAQGDTRVWLGTALFSLRYLATAAVLWLWPGMLAWWASGRAGHEVLESPIEANALQRIALSVLGAWMAVAGLSGVMGHGLTMWFLHDRLSDYSSARLPASEWRWLIYYLVQMLAGAWLVAGARGLTALLAGLRGPAVPVGSEDAVPLR